MATKPLSPLKLHTKENSRVLRSSTTVVANYLITNLDAQDTSSVEEMVDKEVRQDMVVNRSQERAEEVEVVGNKISIGILNVVKIKG
ncbi:hypothetical protein RO3G_12547 [Rhizopus delemar RA 99-880]|uniref:Uncharacterized protein n=1 Tax=Rhizopus delemar (strain RA 99-880 / ATCC MYA-4621 / FGSC 9543 / NRRL 43880) TaxID=246409 RepID=I1CHA6_RHIO9|nr:hypothetical protein RO3G_12547 [Rhizopus delemar RA 99-880]|eukprot:EIE87836.1 hypothetical protein RO3G_12547 [Rhizopus delemar RA 99-880]